MSDDHAESIKSFIDHSTGFIHFRDEAGNVVAEIFQNDHGDSILRHAAGESLCNFHHMNDGSQLITGADGQHWGTLSGDIFGDSVFHDLQDGHHDVFQTDLTTVDGSMGHVHDDMGAPLGDFQVHDIGQTTIMDVNFDPPSVGDWDCLL